MPQRAVQCIQRKSVKKKRAEVSVDLDNSGDGVVNNFSGGSVLGDHVRVAEVLLLLT